MMLVILKLGSPFCQAGVTLGIWEVCECSRRSLHKLMLCFGFASAALVYITVTSKMNLLDMLNIF